MKGGENISDLYGSVIGSERTEATRSGTKNSGIRAHIRGWNVGVKVIGRMVNGRAVFDVFRTSGSNGRNGDIFITNVKED
jgi:hypothetical protein